MAATYNRQFKNICVLSGFNYGKHKEFVEAAIDLDRSIAERKFHLVYGGGNRGLSKFVSEAAFVRGSQVLGIIPRALKPLGSFSDSSTGEELVISSMQERITEMLNHADAFIFLPGDLATLESQTLGPFVLESPNNDGNSSSSKKYKLDLTLRL
ncbi:hypothetical protein WN943_003529 [Citrus x changshan-huyou]